MLTLSLSLASMRRTISYFFLQVDPLKKSYQLLLHFIVLFAIAWFILLYMQPPNSIILIVTPIVTEIAAFTENSLKGKISAIIVGCLLFSVGTITFAAFSSDQLILLFLVFFYCFFSLLTALIKPNYRIIACVAIALAGISIQPTSSWVIAINSTININVIGVISILMNIIWSKIKTLDLRTPFVFQLKLSLKRLYLIENALTKNKAISVLSLKDILEAENTIRLYLYDSRKTAPKSELSTLLQNNTFLQRLHNLRLTITSLTHSMPLAPKTGFNQSLIEQIIKDAINRLMIIIGHFAHKPSQKNKEQSLLYAQLHSTVQEGSATINVDTQELVYYLSCLNQDLTNLEEYIHVKRAHDD